MEKGWDCSFAERLLKRRGIHHLHLPIDLLFLQTKKGNLFKKLLFFEMVNPKRRQCSVHLKLE